MFLDGYKSLILLCFSKSPEENPFGKLQILRIIYYQKKMDLKFQYFKMFIISSSKYQTKYSNSQQMWLHILVSLEYKAVGLPIFSIVDFLRYLNLFELTLILLKI